MEKKIEVRVVSILLGALALAVALILVVAPPGETQTAPGEADLDLYKYAEDTVAVGDDFSYGLYVTNLGPNVASNLTITDTLPANLIILDTYTEEGDGCTSAGNTVTCNLEDLGPGLDSYALIYVCATAPGTLTNTATTSSGTADPNPANNTATATTTVIPETPESCPEPNENPEVPIDPDNPSPGTPHEGEEEISAVFSPEIVYAPSLDADQTTSQDSGDIDQQMEGSPGGSQDANTGNFAVPNQDINW